MATKYWFPIHNGSLTSNRNSGSNPFGSLHREMERMFGNMLAEPAVGTAEKPSSCELRSRKFQPDIDMIDEKTHLRVSAELPGMSADDVEIEVHEGTLVMKGEKKAAESSEKEGFYRTERSFGSFQRVITLPEDAEGNDAEAKFENGVLTIRMPKTAPKQAKKIEIK